MKAGWGLALREVTIERKPGVPSGRPFLIICLHAMLRNHLYFLEKIRPESEIRLNLM